MATQAESDYTLATVRNRVAKSLGLASTTGLTLEQTTLYNTALRAEILKYPNAFTPEVYARAQNINTDYGPRGNSDASSLDVFLSSSADTVRTINPLDTQNVKTVGKWLFFGALAVALFWVFLKTPPPPPTTARARA